MHKMSADIHTAAQRVLLINDPAEKAQQCQSLYQSWQCIDDQEQSEHLIPAAAENIPPLDAPGRPDQPVLVSPKDLPHRGIGSETGRAALLHSLAHIEFNAINLALDAVYRFRDMPVAYVTDWLKVAADEGQHFMLLTERLSDFDIAYGDLPAHDGLWDMARSTDHDVLVRMALVPRILEARGLDVAPPMITKLRALKDNASAEILERIYTDEITHVEIGNRWFRYVCEQRHLDGVAVFRDLLKGKNSAYLRSPYNDQARLQAGFTAAEMAVIRQMEQEYNGQS